MYVALAYISAIAWISLLFFLIIDIPVVLFYDLRYIVHTTIANFDSVSVKDLV